MAVVGLTVGLAVGGWFASSVIGKLVNTVIGYGKDQKSWHKTMKGKILLLGNSRTQIESLVFAAERGTVELSPGLQSWLWQLRNAIEAADAVLDDIDYWRLHDEVTGADKAAIAAKKKVLSFARRVAKADPVMCRLQEVVAMFDSVLAGLGTFAQVLAGLHVAGGVGERGRMADNLRETSSVAMELEFFGRKEEVKKIVNWLLEDDVAVVSAMSVVGIGGLGKTALAQRVFNDASLEGKFDVKIWAFVSSRFEPTNITKKMLESATEVKHDVDTLEAAHKNLRKQLMGKRFLLILDDVWNDQDQESWGKVIAPLRCARNGSKVILTTRMGSVADMAGKVVEKHTEINLEGLQEGEYLSLFNKHAFAGVADHEEYGGLPSIAVQISKKLNGIPLAAKTVGAMLNSRLDDKYWTQISESEISNIEHSNSGGLMATLKLSYQHLPVDLQRCFRYCSIYPQGHEFIKEDLVQRWIAAGLIPQPNSRDETHNDVAVQYFDILVRKSFLDLKASFYAIHDLLHELAQNVSMGECFRAVGNEPMQIANTVRHLSLETSNASVLKKMTELKYLRTLLLRFDGDDSQLNDVIGDMLSGFMNLRVLELSVKFLTALPDSIGKLIHLRYLYIGRTQIKRLSPCVCRLYHLQVLYLAYNNSFVFSKECTPVSIHDLIKLKMLSIPSPAIPMISGIGKMTSLEALIGYGVKNEQGHKIAELEKMSELRELVVTDLENVIHPEEAANAKLDCKPHLRFLSLHWGPSYASVREGGGASVKEVLDCLQPHRNLKHLSVNGYGDISLPKWISDQFLPNLTFVRLERCDGLETLPPLGQLRFLGRLILQDIKGVKQIGPEFYGSGGVCAAFPKLEMLQVQQMEGLEQWHADASRAQWFPRLNKLVVTGCAKLRRLPDLPFGLKYLELSFLDEITTLPNLWRPNDARAVASSSLLSSLRIICCSKVTSLADGLLLHPEHLKALEDFAIWNCSELVHFPVEGFTKFSSLKKLAIEECKLVSIPMVPGSLLPPSIRLLTLNSCGDLDMSLHHVLQGLKSISYLELANCVNLTTLPSADVLSGLTALSWLVIQNCTELASLDNLSALPSLKILQIKKCPKLDATEAVGPSVVHGSSLALESLDIDSPSLLLVEPFKSLIAAKSIDIRGCSQILELPEWLWNKKHSLELLALYDALLLQELPGDLPSFSSLQKLMLRNVRQLRALPVLPQSLKILDIFACSPEFAEKYKEDGGLDWSRIAHVPDVTITPF